MTKFADEIHIRNIRNMNRIRQYIDKLPKMVRGDATEVAAQVFIDKLRVYPPYVYVSRRRAYGNRASGVTGIRADSRGWFSAKQRRWFFWALKSGLINPGVDNRTNKISEGWVLQKSGTKVQIENKAPGVKWVMGDMTQARQPHLVGWETAGVIIRHKETTDAAIKAMGEYIQLDIQQKLSADWARLMGYQGD